MSNPYQSPPSGFDGGNGSQQALGKVKPVAMTLLIVTAVSMLLRIGVILLNLVNAGAGAAAGGDEGMGAMIGGTMGVIFGVVSLFVGGFVIFGALKMMKLESYGLAMAAAILSMLPCIAPCCILGLPIGIWAIVVLNDSVVKSSFR